MLKKSTSKSFFIICLMIFSNQLMAQNNNLDSFVDDTKNDFLIVVGGGLAGAVLGLSTLSFVEEPKEHTRNILVGASIGIIAGVAVVAFSQANKTQNMMYGAGTYMKKDSRAFDSASRASWHFESQQESRILSPFSYHYSYTF